jgi:hypothetical protein
VTERLTQPFPIVLVSFLLTSIHVEVTHWYPAPPMFPQIEQRKLMVERWLACIELAPSPQLIAPISRVSYLGNYCYTGRDEPQVTSTAMMVRYHIHCDCFVSSPPEDEEEEDAKGEDEEKGEDSVELLEKGLREKLQYGNDYHYLFLR